MTTLDAAVKWGILSTADINRKVIPGVHASKKVELIAVASRDLRRAEEYAREWEIDRAYGSYEALLEDDDVEAVYISLPNTLHWQAEDRGDDAKPELAASSATGNVAGTRVDPELAQQLERVAQPVGDTLQHGADERAAVVAEREPGESGPGVRVRVGRPLTGEVGEEGQPLSARRPFLCRRGQLVVPAPTPESVAQPAQRAGRGQHDSHRVPAARNGVAEHVHAGLRIGGEGRQCPKHGA